MGFLLIVLSALLAGAPARAMAVDVIDFPELVDASRVAPGGGRKVPLIQVTGIPSGGLWL